MFVASSLLFVPGSRPDRFAKARDAGASMTIIDLEDAVAAEDKESARDAALVQFAEDADGYALRINAVTTAAGIRDLAALLDTESLPDTIFLPMVESVTEIDVVAQALNGRCPDLIPLIETPRALRHALEIASHDKVSAVLFGGGDFSGELGVKLAWEPLLAARQQVILACAEARVPAIDVPYINLDDEEGLAEECARSRAIGFSAKAAIHPRQVPAIEQAFVPSEREVNEAAEALRAYADGGERAIRHNGRMLEAPMVKQYRAVLARSKGTADA